MCAIAFDSAENNTPLPDASKSSVPNLPQRPSILMIGRDATLLAYKAAVLSSAALAVKTALPPDATALLQDAEGYRIVILSHTLDAADVMHLGTLVRSRSSNTKILLLAGPDTSQMPLDFTLFDAIFRGLDGPAAFVNLVRSLAPHAS